jgi:hypothetical protein
MANLRNLRHRPAAPSKGNGPVQRGIRRAFVASGAEVLSGSEIYDWTHARRRVCGKRLPAGVYSRTRRTLATMADRVGRARTRGRSWLWRLREPE